MPRDTLVRVFYPTQCEKKGVSVKDFHSLDEHPDLILYEGYYWKSGKLAEAVLQKSTGTGPSLLEQKLREGAITDVGVTSPPSGAMKWLGRIGTFLMMGGWILLLILIIGIVFAVSMLSR